MNKLPSRLVGACSAILGAALIATPAAATTGSINIYSYAAKFICDSEDETNEVETTVNIHNPSLHQNVDYLVKLVVPDYEPYWLEGGSLRPDTMAAIECPEPAQPALATINPEEIEGFLVILSRKPLDVVGVYEVEHSDGESEETEDVDVVAVTPQRVSVPLTVWNSLGPD